MPDAADTAVHALLDDLEAEQHALLDLVGNIAWLATRALPYAYTVAGREPPSEPVRVELTLPSGATWSTGPEDATNRITGGVGEYCRVFVQRLRPSDTATLRAEGAAA